MGISRSEGGGIGVATQRASAAMMSAGVWNRLAGSFIIIRSTMAPISDPTAPFADMSRPPIWSGVADLNAAIRACVGVPVAGPRTTSTGVHPRHDRDGARVVGYTAYQSLVVTTGDVVGVGSLVEASAGAAGDALTIDHVGFEVGDPGPVLARARESAFADARSKAQQYAALARRGLGAVTLVVTTALLPTLFVYVAYLAGLISSPDLPRRAER